MTKICHQSDKSSHHQKISNSYDRSV